MVEKWDDRWGLGCMRVGWVGVGGGGGAKFYGNI